MAIICKYCNKEYASYSSRSNHIRKYHNNDVNQSQPKVNPTHFPGQPKVSPVHFPGQPKVSHMDIPCQPKVIQTIIKCSKCERIFKHKQSKWKHEQHCNYDKNKELLLLQEKISNYEKEKEQLEKLFIEQLNTMKKETLELLKKTCKVHPKTLNKINKQLNVTNNTLNDNKVINNNIIIQLGKEKLSDVFTKKEQIKVLEQGYQSLAYLVQYTHFNPKYPQFKNILITNLQNNIAYKFNPETNNFDVVKKEELLNEIISERMYNIQEFFDQYKDEITIRMHNIIEAFIEKMDNESYETDKKNDIKIIIYNNSDITHKINKKDLII